MVSTHPLLKLVQCSFVSSLATLHYLSLFTLVMGTWSPFLATQTFKFIRMLFLQWSMTALMNLYFSFWLLWFFMLYLYLQMNWNSQYTLTVNTCFHTLYFEVPGSKEIRVVRVACQKLYVTLHDGCAAQVTESGELIEVTLPLFIVCVSIPGHDCGLQASVHIISHQQIYNTLVPYLPVPLILYFVNMSSAMNNFFFVEKKSLKKVKNGFLMICW